MRKSKLASSVTRLSILGQLIAFLLSASGLVPEESRVCLDLGQERSG